MAKSKIVDFRPAWADARPETLAALEETPTLGFPPDLAPRLPTRIRPVDEGYRISAPTLYDTLYFTQRILIYNAYEVVHGPNPDETPDLRSIDDSVFQLAQMHVEPFGEGSFVIPAAFGEDVVRISEKDKVRQVTSRDVLKRFVEVMNGVRESGATFPTNLGVIDAIESLGKVFNREATRIEYEPSGIVPAREASRAITVDTDYISRVARAKLERKNRRSVANTLDGLLTAVDVLDFKLRVRLFDPPDKVIPGRFAPFQRDKAVSLLGKPARLYGTVKYQRDIPVAIDVIDLAPFHREAFAT